MTTEQEVQVSMSPTIGKIAASIAKAQAAMGPAIKDREGIIPGKDGRQGYRYGYATLAACFEALQPFADNGIAIVQIPLAGGNNGIRVATYLLHESEEWIRGELWMPASVATPQGFGGALTYARRYCLQALTGLAADDDDGSQAEQQTRHAPQAAPPQTSGNGGAKAAPKPPVDQDELVVNFGKQIAAAASKAELKTVGAAIAKSPLDKPRREYLGEAYESALAKFAAPTERQPGQEA